MGRTRVKICCIESVDDARTAVRRGASAIGLVSSMPSGPGVISEDRIAEIAAQVPPAIGTFLLTSQLEAEAILGQQRRCGVNTLQLVDRVEDLVLRTLRRELPGIALVQVIHVRDRASVDEARRIAPLVDAILLDSGDPDAPVRELGGTGRTHDWGLSRTIRDAVAVPVFLAGGLRPENVADAIAQVAPYAVDVCSGVRTAGRLDASRVAAFLEAVRGASR